MRAKLILLTAAGLLIAASGPVTPATPSTDSLLAAARSDAKTAADRLAKLEQAAAKAGDDAERLHRQQAAAAAAIDEAEARISEAQAESNAARAGLALAEARLAERRAPMASLLAGLVTMGRQPPLLVLADHGGADELVRVKALLDATRPVIEARSAALRADLARRQALADTATKARDAIMTSRRLLEERRTQFAALERKALQQQRALAGQSVIAGDAMLASDETLTAATDAAAQRKAALALAAEIAPLGLAPARPIAPDGKAVASPLPYRLPVDGQVVEGLGSINSAGIVSRGLKLDAARGTVVRAPASGQILFAAPYRGQDGVIIIDHGHGRSTLLLGVSADVKRGDRVTIDQPIGRALGPVSVEFRQTGVPKSPAFIAASSVPLSNGGKAR